MKEHRLLERIAQWSQAQHHRSNRTQVDVLVHSVSDHLRRLLNTRQGSVMLDADFGVPDFTNLAGGLSAGSLHAIEDEICRMVDRYEPRLKSPRVRINAQTSDVLNIHFLLEGRLEVDHQDIELQLASTIGANGRVEVRAC